MLRGPGRRPALTTTLAAAMLLCTAAAAPAATGGAGLSSPAPAQRVAKAPRMPRIVLLPVRRIPQLAAGVAVRRVSRVAASAATLGYVSHARGPLQVRVDVVRLADGLSVFADERTVAPEAPQTIRWSGRVAGGLALDGRYEFRIALGSAAASRSGVAVETAGGAAPAPAAPPPGSAAIARFLFVGAIFPVRGTHDYGEEGARFGAGRRGHVHQGQDVMAPCGTPLVAARGGAVVQRARHAAAGNYLVIHDPISGQDHMYAHLREPATVREGQRVATGQQIGIVGATGDASACHLHFELWTAPGWYAGGAPIDPLETLQRWDRLS